MDTFWWVLMFLVFFCYLMTLVVIDKILTAKYNAKREVMK